MLFQIELYKAHSLAKHFESKQVILRKALFIENPFLSHLRLVDPDARILIMFLWFKKRSFLPLPSISECNLPQFSKFIMFTRGFYIRYVILYQMKKKTSGGFVEACTE